MTIKLLLFSCYYIAIARLVNLVPTGYRLTTRSSSRQLIQLSNSPETLGLITQKNTGQLTQATATMDLWHLLAQKTLANNTTNTQNNKLPEKEID